ncbi:MAG: glycoside hydrolase [Blastocatellia bacterium]|nr:glycoside hydrolase [Blastocatellia bacterium]
MREVASPAAPGSGEPNLYAAADGRVFLSWIEPAGEKGHALRFAVRNGDNWSEPRTIAEGANWFVNWADFPSLIVLPDGMMVAHWLAKSGTGTYAYDVNISRSTDGGRSWSKPMVPHRDGTQTEHGFVSFIEWKGGRAGAVWLDGRNFASKEHGAGGHGASSAEMTLRFAAIDSKGQLSDEAVLDGRVCECCQTSAAITSDGAIVVYRDRSEKEVRDISVIRYHKGRWTEPKTIHADGWEINGCPVNGPSVAADGRKVAVAWFTAQGDKPRVNVAFSDDAGANFGQPVQVDDGNPMGRVQVIMLTDGSALVVWLERTAKGGEIRARRVKADGMRDQSITVGNTSAARAAGFPRMVRAGNEVVFAWTESGKPSKVRTAVGKLSGRE